jgi:hypothetical protein
MSENDILVRPEELSRELAGLVVSELIRPAADTILVRFTDGALLTNLSPASTRSMRRGETRPAFSTR